MSPFPSKSAGQGVAHGPHALMNARRSSISIEPLPFKSAGHGVAQLPTPHNTSSPRYDPPVLIAVANTLKVGAGAEVLFPQHIGMPSLQGTMEHVATVPDPGSETQLIRIIVPNPDGLPGGSHVVVTFQ
jgi:hypothetical protein